MKIWSVFQIWISIIVLSGQIDAQQHNLLPRTVEEVLKRSPVSRLDDILNKLNKNRDSLTVEDIREIFEKHRDDFYGNLSETSKFYTLLDLCQIIQGHPEKDEMRSILLDEFQNLAAIQEEPKDWDEIMIKGKGGSLGQLVTCLLNIDSGSFELIFDSALKENNIRKMQVILDQVRLSDKLKSYNEYISNNIENSSSKEMKALLQEFLKSGRGFEEVK